MALQLRNNGGNSQNNKYRNQSTANKVNTERTVNSKKTVNSEKAVNAIATVKTVNTAGEEPKKQSPIETEKERWAKIRAEEEEKVRAEQRVREKKMDQTEALIAAIRAQVEKEKAAKAAAEKKANEKAGMSKSASAAGNKPQFRTISPEEMERLEERKRRKAAGLPVEEEPIVKAKPVEQPIPTVQPKPVEQPKSVEQPKPTMQPKAMKEENTVEVAGGISGGLGGLKGGPSLSNPRGDGPTLQNLNPGQETLNSGIKKTGLGIEITEPAKTSSADESTVTLNVDAINAAVEASNKAKNKTVVLDEASSSWGEQEDALGDSNEETGWVSAGTASKNPQEESLKNDSFVDENGDVVSVIPVRQRPVDKDDVQSAYNIDFDDEDDEIMSFDSAKSAEDAKNKVEEARHRAEEEARRKAEEEARHKAEEEARRKAEEEARRKAEEEARRKAEEEARRKAEEEARRRAEEEARRKAEEEARRKAEEEARRKAEEEARRKAEEEARRKAEEEARRRAEEEARRKAEEEARRRAEEEARRRAEEEARRRAEEEARRKAEEEARRREEEARRKAEEEARRRAEEEARRKAEEEARRKAEEEARRRAEEEARRRAEEEARRKAEEEARRKVEEAARRRAEEEAKRRAEEEARRRIEEETRRRAEEAKRKAEEEAKRKAEEEAKRKAEEEAKRKAEEEAKRKAEEEAKRKAEEEAKRKAEEAAKRAERGFALPVGAEQFLEKYLSVNAISDQIVRTVQDISANPDEPRNIVILGQYGFGTTAIAEDFAKSFYALGVCKNKTIAKIKAGALNRTDITGTIGRLQGGCLVIENAGVISNEKLDEIYHLVSNPDNDVVVIMTGQIEMLSKIFKDNVLITAQFRHLIQVHRITDLDVFTIAKEHAYISGYPCGPEAEAQLRRRMQTVESGNLDRVLRIVDNAISKAYNREQTTGEQEHRLYADDFE